MGQASAIVLTGGTARRLGGADKCWVALDGPSPAQRVLLALAAQIQPPRRIVVVGPRRETDIDVTWTREEPPTAGPVAAIRAGLDALSEIEPAGKILVVAGDMPFAGTALPGLLSEPLPDGTDVLLATDEGARDQYLFACWRAGSLRRAVADKANDAPVRSLFQDVAVARRPVVAEALVDCDTSDDLAAARLIARRWANQDG